MKNTFKYLYINILFFLFFKCWKKFTAHFSKANTHLFVFTVSPHDYRVAIFNKASLGTILKFNGVLATPT